MSDSSKFWDRMAKGYAKKAVPDEAIYKKKLAATQSFLSNDMKVLEFACGTGSTALEHAPLVKSYQAIDISKNMIQIAKDKQSKTEQNNLEFSVDDFEELDEVDGSYDMILGLSILHLMDDPQRTINSVFKMLKKGGLFVSSSACIKDRMPLLKYIGPVGHWLGLIPKLAIFSQAELEAMLVTAGFSFEFQLTPQEGSEACFYICRKS